MIIDNLAKLIGPKVIMSLVLIALSGVALAGPFEDAGAAYTRKDYATALRLLRPLADKGDVSAQYGLGRMYYEGEGVPQNHAEALNWYRRAAEQGYVMAQYDAGLMMGAGMGAAPDFVLSHMWLNLAAMQKYEDAALWRDNYERLMTSAQIENARRLMRDWKPKPER
jgi:TPR repeat protein